MSHRKINFSKLTRAVVFIVFAMSSPVVFGQQTPTEQLPAPPPLRIIPKEERAQVSEAKDAKTRLRRTIALVQTHLQHAEKFITAQKYTEALTELGLYAGLIEDSLKVIGALNRDRTGTRDLYKALELDLRADGPRLTSMRRSTPIEYAIRIKEIEDLAHDGRDIALDSFYRHPVVHDDNKKMPDAEKPNP